MGFCFVEFYSPDDAAYVMACAHNQLKINGARVRMSFADSRPSNYQWNQSLYQEFPANPPPGSNFQYDANSGYYYDTVTGYYYESHSKTYFDGRTQTYYNYDFKKMEYVPINGTKQQKDIKTNNQPETTEKKKITKKNKKKKKISTGIKINFGVSNGNNFFCSLIEQLHLQ